MVKFERVKRYETNNTKEILNSKFPLGNIHYLIGCFKYHSGTFFISFLALNSFASLVKEYFSFNFILFSHYFDISNVNIVFNFISYSFKI